MQTPQTASRKRECCGHAYAQGKKTFCVALMWRGISVMFGDVAWSRARWGVSVNAPRQGLLGENNKHVRRRFNAHQMEEPHVHIWNVFCTYHQNLLLSECRAQCSSHSPAHLIRECSDCRGIKIFTQAARCATRRANQIMQARLTSETTTQRTVEDSRQWKLRCSTPSVWIFKVSCGSRSAVQKMKNTDPWRHPSWSVMSSTRVTATTAVNMARSWNGTCRHLAKSTRPVRICFLLQLESKKHFAVIF